jgi:hypothetical protein
MLQSPQPPIVVLFKEGHIERGVLLSSLLSEGTLRYLPREAPGERRTVLRIPLLTEVLIDRLAQRRGVDLSSRGMYLETLSSYAVGTPLHITLRLDFTSIEANTTVVFSDPGIGIGLKFVRLSTAARHRLETVVHRMIDGGAIPAPGRRGDHDRRDARDAAASCRRWDVRKRNRRRVPEPGSPVPVEVDLETVRSVFFVDPHDDRETIPRASVAFDHQVTVEFRDGETIQGTLDDIPLDTPGFFVGLRFNEHTVYSVYVVKSAIKSIQTVF